MQCNIDAKGKLARVIYGAVFLLAGVAATLIWAVPAGGWLAWTVSIFLLVSGMLSIFEARAGWCVVRAMGFKTPM